MNKPRHVRCANCDHPNVHYPGIGKQDDRCEICKRMDDFITTKQWSDIPSGPVDAKKEGE